VASLRVVPIGNGVAQLYVPVVFTIGAPGESPQTTRFLLNQVVVKSGNGWKVMTILPIPAAPAIQR